MRRQDICEGAGLIERSRGDSAEACPLWLRRLSGLLWQRAFEVRERSGQPVSATLAGEIYIAFIRDGDPFTLRFVERRQIEVPERIEASGDHISGPVDQQRLVRAHRHPLAI